MGLCLTLAKLNKGDYASGILCFLIALNVREASDDTIHVNSASLTPNGAYSLKGCSDIVRIGDAWRSIPDEW